VGDRSWKKKENWYGAGSEGGDIGSTSRTRGEAEVDEAEAPRGRCCSSPRDISWTTLPATSPPAYVSEADVV